MRLLYQLICSFESSVTIRIGFRCFVIRRYSSHIDFLADCLDEREKRISLLQSYLLHFVIDSNTNDLHQTSLQMCCLRSGKKIELNFKQCHIDDACNGVLAF